MKDFSETHFDNGDETGGFSAMVSANDLPDGYEGGRFHLVELGFYTCLQNTLQITGFSGLRWHGGTPPLAPKHIDFLCDIPEWAIRWVAILYSQSNVLDGHVTFNIAANEDKTPLQVTRATKDISDVSLYVLSFDVPLQF